MVQSNATTVDGFMTDVDPSRHAALERLRTLCRERLKGWEEKMAWGMPGYGPSGEDPRVSFNSQKQHISFYIGSGPITRLEHKLQGIDRGKGCLRYRRAEMIDFDVVAELLDDIVKNGRS